MPEYWYRKLSHPVVPLSGPLRATRTLGEARNALSEGLPADRKADAPWQRASALMLAASKSGSPPPAAIRSPDEGGAPAVQERARTSKSEQERTN